MQEISPTQNENASLGFTRVGHERSRAHSLHCKMNGTLNSEGRLKLPVGIGALLSRSASKLGPISSSDGPGGRGISLVQ